MSDSTATTLFALERELHQPDVRRDARRMSALLHPAFTEFGRSGRCYDRAAVCQAVAGTSRDTPTDIVAWDFYHAQLAPGCSLVTYRSGHRATDGRLTRLSLRSSIWSHDSAAGWRMRFHQATALPSNDPAFD